MRSGWGNFSWYLKISSPSYNTECGVRKLKQYLLAMLHFTSILHTHVSLYSSYVKPLNDPLMYLLFQVTWTPVAQSISTLEICVRTTSLYRYILLLNNIKFMKPYNCEKTTVYYQFESLMLMLKPCPRGVMVKSLDCGIAVSVFELQSCYYVHFRTNNLAKGIDPLILPV